MSKVYFSEADILILRKNKNIFKVSKKAITYTDEFKRLFIEDYLAGKLPRNIFRENGFNEEVIGVKRIEQSAFRWKAAYERNGIVGLYDSRKTSSGRPRQRALTPQEIIKQQGAKIELLEAQVDLLKKLDVAERRLINNSKDLEPCCIFKLIQTTIESQGFKSMVKYFCELLRVSRSGYYSYLHADASRMARERSDLAAKDFIMKAFDRRGYKKGSRSIKMVLENEYSVIFSIKKIRRIMRKYEIVCPHRKANPYKQMAKATKEHRTLPNSLQRNFKQGIPGLVLLTDITYLPYGTKSTAYLSTILDASTGEVLAHHVSDRITLNIATDTIIKLKKQKRLKLNKDAFIHSDQGVHYTSPQYQELLRKSKLGQSMSRRGNCWDNAPQESFFGHLKDSVDYRSCKTFQEIQSKVDQYIHYYNNHRYQWERQKMTPVQYRNHLLSA